MVTTVALDEDGHGASTQLVMVTTVAPDGHGHGVSAPLTMVTTVAATKEGCGGTTRLAGTMLAPDGHAVPPQLVPLWGQCLQFLLLAEWQRDRQTDGGWVSGWKDGRMGGWQAGTQRCGATKVWPWGCSHRGMCLWDGEWPHPAPQLLARFPHGVGFIPPSSSGRGWAAKPHCHTGETSSSLGPTGKKSKSA